MIFPNSPKLTGESFCRSSITILFLFLSFDPGIWKQPKGVSNRGFPPYCHQGFDVLMICIVVFNCSVILSLGNLYNIYILQYVPDTLIVLVVLIMMT